MRLLVTEDGDIVRAASSSGRCGREAGAAQRLTMALPSISFLSRHL